MSKIVDVSNPNMTVREVVESLGAEYAQVVNCNDKTFRGVVMCQNEKVARYQYDEYENLVYIWIESGCNHV